MIVICQHVLRGLRLQHLQVHARLEMQLEIATAMVVWVQQVQAPKDLQGPRWRTTLKNKLANTIRNV